MDDANEMLCVMCEEEFDDDGDKLPRMLPECGHSVCSACISSRLSQSTPIICPEDKLASSASTVSVISGSSDFEKKSDPSGRRFSDIHSTPRYTINSEESVLSTPISYPEERGCSEHYKKLDIVCVDCRSKICASCALFGKHKGHYVRSEEEVLKEISSRAEELLSMLESIEKRQCYLTDEAHAETVKEYIQSNLKNVETQIHKMFSEIEQIIQEKKEQLIVEVKKKFTGIENNCIEFLQEAPRDAIQQTEKWKIEAKKKLLVLCETNNSEAYSLDLMLDPRIRQQSDVISEGSELLECIERANANLEKKLEEFQFETVDIQIAPNYEQFIKNELISTSSRQDNELSNLLHTKTSISSKKPLSNSEFHFARQSIDVVHGKLDKKSFEIQGSSLVRHQNGKEHTNGEGHFKNQSISLLSRKMSSTGGADDSPVQSSKYLNPMRKNILELEKIHSDKSGSSLPLPGSISSKKNQSNLFQNGELNEDDLLNDDLTDQFNDSVLLITKQPYKFNSPDFYGKSPIQGQSDNIADDNSLLVRSHLHEPQLLDDIDQELFGRTSEMPQSVSFDSQTPKSAQKPQRLSVVPLNDKFKPVLNEISKDTIETADFTFADMGDEGLQGISDGLVNNKQLRTLKLQRNKISDKGAINLIESIYENKSRVQVLYLQDNMISEKFLEFLLSKHSQSQLSEASINLNTIYLRNNLFNLQKVNKIVEDLAKLNLNINFT